MPAPAGIWALQQLRKAGYPDCNEKTDWVGGHWHTNYDALHLITSRHMTHFEDFPMPADYPHFARRDQVRSYIESYAHHHGLYDLIPFNTAVTSVDPIAVEVRSDRRAGPSPSTPASASTTTACWSETATFGTRRRRP